MIRNFDASFRGEGARTVYDSITANFVISDGIVQNDDLLLDAPWGGVEGAGTSIWARGRSTIASFPA
jgi:AsmA protein